MGIRLWTFSLPFPFREQREKNACFMQAFFLFAQRSGQTRQAERSLNRPD